MKLRAITQKAISAAGGGAKLASALKIKRQAVYQWQCIPADRVNAVEKITGIPRHELRPDLYPLERERVSA
jgi:DNA-binding transcriptional regulator YdaS (Cro superfamily)